MVWVQGKVMGWRVHIKHRSVQGIVGAERETCPALQSTVVETGILSGTLVSSGFWRDRAAKTEEYLRLSQSPVLLSAEGDLSAWIRVRSRYMLGLGTTEAFRRKQQYLMKEPRRDELHTTWRVQSPGQDVQQYKQPFRTQLTSSKRGRGSQMGMGMLEESQGVNAVELNRDQFKEVTLLNLNCEV